MTTDTPILSRDPDVHSGDLVFAGTRVPVATLVEHLQDGDGLDEFLEGYPTVARWQALDLLDWIEARLARQPLPAGAAPTSSADSTAGAAPSRAEIGAWLEARRAAPRSSGRRTAGGTPTPSRSTAPPTTRSGRRWSP